ncbi:P-loop containing nucleoside triphosphate hydrolase protein, partial [Tricholoma matsutake]
LYGVQSIAINGKIRIEKRDQLIREFYNPKNPIRVLIFSSIGSAGLNLSLSDMVIFFDQPWSAQDERQIRGRAHRQPQKKIVKVIHLLANDSADLLMNAVARGKRDMFDAFVNKE